MFGSFIHNQLPFSLTWTNIHNQLFLFTHLDKHPQSSILSHSPGQTSTIRYPISPTGRTSTIRYPFSLDKHPQSRILSCSPGQTSTIRYPFSLTRTNIHNQVSLLTHLDKHPQSGIPSHSPGQTSTIRYPFSLTWTNIHNQVSHGHTVAECGSSVGCITSSNCINQTVRYHLPAVQTLLVRFVGIH